jgi:tetratricopeptide (TPR) repeat protein
VRFFALAGLILAASLARAADTVAIVPLFNIDEGRSPNLDWIGESVAETLHESVSSSGVLVLSRDERDEVYRRLSLRAGVVLTKASVIKIGETLDAGQIVFGDFHVDGAETGATSLKSNLRLKVHTIDLKKLHEGPEFTQTGTLENLSLMETKLALMLIRQLAPNRAPSEETFLHDRPPVRVDAVENYTRGLMNPNPEQKMKFFTQAAHLDEHFSQPNFELGRIFYLKKDYRTAGQWLAKVTKADSHFLEASFLRGICRYQQADFDGAIDQFKMVSAEIPLNEVYNDLGAALSRKNDPSALEYFNKALDGDSTDPDYWFNAGYSLWKQGQFEQATLKFRAVLDRSQGDQDAMILLGRCLKMDGPRAGDPRSDGRERIKTAFEDSAYRQLQAELKKKQN